MNNVEIRVFPASYGDSILITCKGEKNTHILVDMGFSSTYEKSIRKELKKINDIGEKLSLLVFTHADEDHILGGIKFIKENGHIDECKIINIDEVWQNSFRHLQFEKKTELKKQGAEKLISILKNIVERGYIREKGLRTISDISLPQGSTLASLLYENGYVDIWNKSYKAEAIEAKTVKENDKEILKYVCINDEVRITVLSPDNKNLSELDEEWRKALIKLGYADNIENSQLMDDAFEIYMASLQDHKKNERIVRQVSYRRDDLEDVAREEYDGTTSKINASSIAFILEFYDKKLLFLGDSCSETVKCNLRRFLNERSLDKIHFDAVKISHHGSKHNTSMDLLSMIEADRYIISTNGKGRGNSHPDIECVYRIIVNKSSKNKELIFNYKPIKIFSKINRDDLKIKYNYSIRFENDPMCGESNKVTYVNI
jgi:beta-lactamase superfamily II metal-dependent hydrolase